MTSFHWTPCIIMINKEETNAINEIMFHGQRITQILKKKG